MTSLGFSHLLEMYYSTSDSLSVFLLQATIVSMTLCVFLASSSLLSFFHPHVSAFISALGPSCSHRAPRCTLTEQRASLSTRAAVLMHGYLRADAPSKRWWSWYQCNIQRAPGGQTAKSNSHHLANGFWIILLLSFAISPIHIFMWLVNLKPLFLHSDFT